MKKKVSKPQALPLWDKQNAAEANNKYCAFNSLKNESDVEQFFVLPLLIDLGYTPDYLETKANIQKETIGKGKGKKQYFPDYLAYSLKGKEKPVLIIDAKHPDEAALDGVEDAQLYASVIRRHMSAPKLDQYCVGVNGHKLLVKHYDSDIILHELDFADFVDGNPKFEALKNALSRDILAAQQKVKAQTQPFEFRKVTSTDLPSIFELCHRKIWKAEKRSPSSAFYEFAKIMFVKISEDRKLHEKIAAKPPQGLPTGCIPREYVRFSVHWINEMEELPESPINSLFSQLAQSIELQILEKQKKRIFEQNEGINLTPSTVKEVVKILEHLDLYEVDEDLNGRLFETFLTATMRGEALGQFFTPRAVVKFMVKLAKLHASPLEMDKVLDGCCGTGGFLIEAMADMSDAINSNKGLSAHERELLMKQLRTEALWGIDAGKDPPIARIARLNMLLHKDGGSRIYYADSLDKKLRLESGLPISTQQEIDELRKAIVEGGMKFSVVLTNPPFAMTYEKKDAKELAVLKNYTLYIDSKGRPRPSLKSSVMFLERYWDLLEDDGRLLTIMDDSVLNTRTAEPFREYILSHFVIKAVISLPKNAFVRSQGTVSTSVLYLKKKTDSLEAQPSIFMALCPNIGHSDSGKDRPKLNELPQILARYNLFEEKGKLSNQTSTTGFIVDDLLSNNSTKRLDAQFFNPRYFSSINSLEKIAQERGWKVIPLKDLLSTPVKEALTGGATPLGAAYPDEGPKFIRVQNVRPNRLVWNSEEDACIDTHTHTILLKRSQLREDDVVFTITGSYGVAAVVPDNFGEANINQHSVRIRVNKVIIVPQYLSVFLNSDLCRPQIDRSVTGSSRLALDYTAIKELKILVPPDKDEQRKIAKTVMDKLAQADTLRSQSEQIESQMLHIMN